MRITVGCDPELFVTKDGKFRSAHGLIPGTKESPHKVEFGAVQVDGMALEFNIDPVDNADDFVKHNQQVMAQMKNMVPGYEFAIVPSCRFNGNHFRNQPDEAKELGCTPDYNAYTMQENPKPDNKTTTRTASGHIHIGFCEGADPMDADHMIRCSVLVKQLDMFLGLPSLFYDKDITRRKMYGAAGAFRPKSYGVEYRVLSNSWLLSEERMRFVYNQTVAAVDSLVSGHRPFERLSDWSIRSCIDNSNLYNANRYLSDYVNNGKNIIQQAKNLTAVV